MAHIPSLRSPYEKVGRLVYFGRMIDKIRLHAAGRLPAEYVGNLGTGRPQFFDARCCRFLGIDYAALVERVKKGGTDGDILAWAEKSGAPRTDEECQMWNRFMTKIGWRDDRSAALQQRIAENGLSGRTVETFFDMIEYDEGRDPQVTKPWERV